MSDQDDRFEAGDPPAEQSFHVPAELPVLPLRDTVLFPNSFMPLAVARESSVRLIDEAVSGGRMIAVFTQREATEDEPRQDDLFPSAPPATSTRCSSCPTAACASSCRAWPASASTA